MLVRDIVARGEKRAPANRSVCCRGLACRCRLGSLSCRDRRCFVTEATGERTQAMEEGSRHGHDVPEGSAGPVEDRRRRRGLRIDAVGGVLIGLVAACPEIEHRRNGPSSGQTGRGGLAGAGGIPLNKAGCTPSGLITPLGSALRLADRGGAARG